MRRCQVAALAALLVLLLGTNTWAFTVLGTGAGALLGGDLTDPDNNGAADADVNYDAIFSSNDEPGFGGGEFSFNIFDNQVGGGNAKWCCNNPDPGPGPGFQVDAAIQPTGGNPVAPDGFQLTHFTITSSNDTPGRDPLNWQILGSNDGTNFDVIFDSLGTDFWPGGVRNQVLRFDENVDYVAQTMGYSIFRYSVTLEQGSNAHALNEIEYFGIPFVNPAAEVPEPSSVAIWTLLGLAGLGLGWWRMRRKSK